jgi:hypothetical protein
VSAFQPLFSIEEAMNRLTQSGGAGCLNVFTARESIRVFVKEGRIVGATGAGKSPEEALDRAWLLADSSYRWTPDEAPEKETLQLDIQDYISNRSQTREVKFKTLRLETFQKRERKKLDFQYFFVPEEMPTVKLRLKKSASVAGREATSDLVIDSFQVSRRHCLLEVTDRGVLVKDLDSTNGTFINGMPLKDGYLNEGDRLSLGTYGMTLRREKV